MPATRRTLIAAAAALGLLAACDAQSSGVPNPEDMALGPADAKVTVIEYASTACGHCADFHENIFPKLKDNYINTGKIRFVYREYPTGSLEIATAGALLARCVGDTPEKYFETIDLLFEKQRQIFEAAQQQRGREKLLEIAASGGVSEQEFDRCMTDEAAITRLSRVAEEGQKQFNVSGTPTIIVNGQVIPNTRESPYTYEKIAAVIDAKL